MLHATQNREKRDQEEMYLLLVFFFLTPGWYVGVLGFFQKEKDRIAEMELQLLSRWPVTATNGRGRQMGMVMCGRFSMVFKSGVLPDERKKNASLHCHLLPRHLSNGAKFSVVSLFSFFQHCFMKVCPSLWLMSVSKITCFTSTDF